MTLVSKVKIAFSCHKSTLSTQSCMTKQLELESSKLKDDAYIQEGSEICYVFNLYDPWTISLSVCIESLPCEPTLTHFT